MASTRKKKDPAEFFDSRTRAERGVERTQFHMLMDESVRVKLAKLTHKHKMSAADVVRSLILGAT